MFSENYRIVRISIGVTLHKSYHTMSHQNASGIIEVGEEVRNFQTRAVSRFDYNVKRNA